MSLSAAFNIISSSFAANAAQTAVVSNNIANANTPGYSREVANLATISYGGVDVASVKRMPTPRSPSRSTASTAQAAAQQAIARVWAARRHGRRQRPRLVDVRRAPERLLAVGDAGQSSERADDLRRTRRPRRRRPTQRSPRRRISPNRSTRATTAVNQVREQADQDMASSVSTINSLLAQFQTANDTVVSGLASGANVANAEDTRDSLVTQLSQQIGVTTTTDRERLDVDLHGQRRHAVPGHGAHSLVHADPTFADGVVGSPVTVDGVPDHRRELADADPVGRARRLCRAARHARAAISGPARPDRGGLIDAFAESDQTNRQQPSSAGPLHDAGRDGLPAVSNATGLAAAIEVNPTVDPLAGRKRDPAARRRDQRQSAYVYNTTGAASYTARLQSSRARSARRRASTPPPASARRRASPTTPTPR